MIDLFRTTTSNGHGFSGALRRACVAFAALLLVAVVAAAQQSWSERTRVGEYAFAYDELERAEEEFLGALAIAEAFETGDRRLETSLENVGRLYEHTGRYVEAGQLFERSLEAKTARLGAEHGGLLDVLAALARVSGHLGDQAAAESYLRRFESVAESSGRADLDQELEVLAQLALLLAAQERSEEALPIQRRIVELRRADSRSTPEEIADALESLAWVELVHGSEESGEQLILEAVELRAASGEGAGSAPMLAGAAATSASLGSLDVAERLAQRALMAGLETGGTYSEMVAAHRALAEVAWLRVRRPADSIVTLLEVSDQGPDVAAAQQRLAILYELAPDEQTARRLAQVHAIAGDLDGATRWQAETLRLVRDARGRDGAQSIPLLADLVELQVRAGQADQAAASNAELIRLLEGVYGSEDARLVGPLGTQVELLTDLGRKKEAKPLKKRLRQLEKAQR